jgi:hypothetical protein
MTEILSHRALKLLIYNEYNALKNFPVRFSLPYKIRHRILPIYDVPIRHFEKFYEVTNNGNLHAYETNYGFVVYPNYQLEKNDRISEKLDPVENTPDKLPKRIYCANKTITYAYATILKSNTRIPIARKAFRYLLMEEISTGRKSKLTHRHMMRLSKIQKSVMFIKKAVTHVISNNCRLKKYSPEKMPKRFSSLDEAKGRLYKFAGNIIDYAINNVYIVGSSILYSLDNEQKEEDYKDSDVDILIDTETWEEFDIIALKIIGNNRYEKIEGRKDSYRYRFDGEKRPIELFRSKIGTIVGYHVPMVRGAYNNSDFIVVPSLISAIIYKEMWEYRWVKAHAGVIDILIKYANRGYKILLSKYEHEVLTSVENNDNFIIAIYIPDPYNAIYPSIKSEIRQKQHHNSIYDLSTSPYCSTYINIDNSSASLAIGMSLIILDPGESYTCKENEDIKNVSVKNSYLTHVLRVNSLREKQTFKDVLMAINFNMDGIINDNIKEIFNIILMLDKSTDSKILSELYNKLSKSFELPDINMELLNRIENKHKIMNSTNNKSRKSRMNNKINNLKLKLWNSLGIRDYGACIYIIKKYKSKKENIFIEGRKMVKMILILNMFSSGYFNFNNDFIKIRKIPKFLSDDFEIESINVKYIENILIKYGIINDYIRYSILTYILTHYDYDVSELEILFIVLEFIVMDEGESKIYLWNDAITFRGILAIFNSDLTIRNISYSESKDIISCPIKIYFGEKRKYRILYDDNIEEIDSVDMEKYIDLPSFTLIYGDKILYKKEVHN